MDKETRNLLFNTTQAIRRLLEEEFSLQLEGTFDVHADGRIAEQPGSQLSAAERLVRCRIVEAIQHRLAVGESAAEAVRGFQSEAVFTFLNRLAALKMMEARALVLPCVSQGDESQGFKEFSGLAPGLIELPDKGYRLYLECLFDEIGREVGVLFDRTDAASQLWPRRKALEAVLAKLNTPELAGVWAEDETIGWIYQYYNDPEERKQMREESSAPRNSRELAVRNQFFTPRYVVEFLTDNTLGRIWYEMTKGQTRLKDQCRYLVRRPNEIFLGPASEVRGQHQGAASAKDSASTLNPDAEPCTLSQEDLLRQPVHIPHRPLKDPREIRMIDPACGSMHFGLYAFELFSVIYDEAWEMAHGMDAATKSAGTFTPFVTFVASFADKAAFLREVPRLIVEHNIHGIDIDPRAAQIAGLALWLRAQRGWQALGLKSSDRPPIRRSNIVCAEPMPGERGLLREFVDRHFPQGERSLFQSFLENVWDKMRLAGEAGSLLKIEEEIRSAIADARDAWNQFATKPLELFTTTELNQLSTAPELTGLEQAVSSLTTDPQPMSTDFWERIEERIYAALRDYAEQAENGGGFQRRLFAEDAARGFAFIDVCRKRYDVALMNPPFGEGVPATRSYLLEAYPTGSKEMATCFVEMGADFTGRNGLVGAITSRFMLANDGLIEWRKDEFLDETWNIQSFADLGYGVLDGAMVEACSYIVGSNKGNADRPFVNCLDDSEKGEALLTATTSLMTKPDRRVALRSLQSFRSVPDYIICYWLPDHLLQAVLRFENIKAQGSAARVGLQTGDNERFARAVWEVSATNIGQGKDWFYFAKGGEYEPFYDDIHLVVLWKDDGYLLKRFVDKNGKLLSRPQNLEYFCREGITYPDRTTSDFSPRVMPSGIIFSSTGFALFPPNQGALLGYLGSAYTRPFKVLVEAFVGSGDSSVSGSAARHYRPGILNLLPNLLPAPEQALQQKIVRSIQTRIRTFETDETSRYFSAFPNLNSSPSIRGLAAVRWLEYVEEVVFLIETNVELEVAVRNVLGIAVDDPVLDELYGLHPAALDGPPPDAQAVLEAQELSEEALIERLVSADGAGRSTVKKSYFADRRIELVCRIFRISPKSFAAILNGRKVAPKAFALEFTQSLVSIALGVAFGRWDIRYATGEQAAPELPDPFAPLPVCPPGQLQNAQGLPARPEDVPAAYPVRIPWDGILVDDPNHPRDLELRVREVIEIIWNSKDGGPTAEAIEHEACEILGVKSLRDYFRKPAGFFADHLKRYSKSRRQAPIYWPLSSPNGLYTVWLYYHRLTPDTLFTVLRDHVKPKLEYEERQAFQLRQEAGATPSTSQRRDIAEAEELVEDLRAFKAELDRVAPLFRPDLNDGVIINHAPLWRMIGLPKWRKDCQATWNELAKGDYDWAHLALHLWPERVIPKCATDRSLAIAHGLDAIFWREDPEKPGKWISRKVTDLELRGLIAERTSAAVKAAVESLVGATSNEGAPRRGRKGAKA
jgi:hypothetical protein